MKNYFNIFIILTLLYIIYLFNYIILRETDQYLYLANFFNYKKDYISVLFYYILTIPFITFIVKNSFSQIFSFLLSTIIILGVLPGIVIYSLSDDKSIIIFILMYVYLVFIFSIFSRKNINFNITNNNSEIYTKNYNILKLFGFIGFFFYFYLVIKYFNYISLTGLNDVYIQRNIFTNLVITWEAYLITFSKYISAFSFLSVAIISKNKMYLIPAIFIYLIDYSLAAHKGSIVLCAFVIFYYFINEKITIKIYYRIVFITIFLISLIMNLSIYLNTNLKITVVSLYDRIFHVTSGLFARFYDFANENYFFYGGNGLIGKLFYGVDEPYMLVVGEYYFSENVVANADLIADSYLNFGVVGTIIAIFLLWTIFGKKDNSTYKANVVLLLPFLFVYSINLFSMGLQTTLLTGGMIFFIILFKSVFKIEKIQ